MELQQLFPAWRAASSSTLVPWALEIDLSTNEHFGSLLSLIALDQSTAGCERPTEFQAICQGIISDILALQAAPPEGCDVTNLHYLQFEAALVPLRLALLAGDFGLMHDWIINSCADEISHAVERRFAWGRLYDFAATDIAWIAANRGSTFTDWSFAFYYYCRRRAALFEVAEGVLPAVLRVLNEFPALDDRAVEAGCMIANWAAAYGHPAAEGLARRLERLFGAPQLSLPARLKIAVLFATQVGTLSGRSPRDWAGWALENGSGLLGSHEPFQLIFTRIETLGDWDSLKPAALAAAEHYARSLRVINAPTAVAQALDQRATLLAPAVVKLAGFDRGDDLLEVLTRWYDVPPVLRLNGGVLFVIAGHPDGVTYLGHRRQVLSPLVPHQLLELVQATNAALGISLTVEGETIVPELLGRAGQPDYEQGRRWERALVEVYRPDEIDEAVLEGRTALISFPGQPHPLQALMAASRLGVTLPIASSLQQPVPDAEVRRAMLWAADNDNFSGFEIDAVQSCLETAGIAVDRRSGAGATADDFYEAYSDPAYDLLWVAGHGEVDHWRDGSTRLLAGDQCSIGIDELVGRTPRRERRRLFMINICDGGVSAVNGGIQRLGLAPMLASSVQATISHLWPVRPQVVSAFGVMLAHRLAMKDAQIAAFAAALKSVRGTSAEVTERVARLIPELPLVDRLRNSDLDTGNILNWGSGCFFQ